MRGYGRLMANDWVCLEAALFCFRKTLLELFFTVGISGNSAINLRQAACFSESERKLRPINTAILGFFSNKSRRGKYKTQFADTAKLLL